MITNDEGSPCRRDPEPVGTSPRNQLLDSSLPCGSYSRFSSDLQDETSIVDQRRKCLERAMQNGHCISPQLEFADEAISGTKLHRAGLDAMLAEAAAGRIKVLYFHSLSRLSRESVITLPLLKQLVHNYGVRVISTSEGIDSNDTAWELIAHIMAIVHEQYIKDLAANVLRGQEGAVLAGFSVGDYCFGFTSVPIPGSEQGRRGRSAKPRKIYAIDPETAAWVARIFDWFVRERRPLRWIAKELNRLGAPKDHRSTTKPWRHQYVSKLLCNRKYIGWWSWGQKTNVRDPLTGKIRQKDRPPEEGEKFLRHFPDLQLIDDKTFEEAQRLLKINEQRYASRRKKDGKFARSTGNGDEHHPRHLLAQLIRCGQCGRAFRVGGTNAKYLCCSGYGLGTCTCRSHLPRDRAEKMILDEIGHRILASPAWRELVLQATRKAWATQEAQLPSELAAAQKALAETEQKIAKLIDSIEEGNGGSELDKRFIQRRTEKRELAEKVERLQRADQNRPSAPTEHWVEEKLHNLRDILSKGGPAAAYALRNLVGGKIVVTEIRPLGQKRRHLQGRFTIRLTPMVATFLGAEIESGQNGCGVLDAGGEEITIDFREPPAIVALSEEAKQFYDRGMMNAQIAKEMGRSRSCVTKLLKFWFESRGLVMPDGRSRRSTLTQKHIEPPLYQRIADEVMVFYQQGALLQDIAQRMNIDRNTVTAVIRHWHVVRGLPVPDGRTRRKELAIKTSRTEELHEGSQQAGQQQP